MTTMLHTILAILMQWQPYDFVWPPDTHPLAYVYTWPLLPDCMTGPGVVSEWPGCTGRFDTDADGDVDLEDAARFTAKASGG